MRDEKATVAPGESLISPKRRALAELKSSAEPVIIA
jgi:hypothetical protein